MKKEQTKPTNAQLARRIEKAVLHIDKTKDTMSVFFGDRGLRLTVTEDYAIIETGSHSHVYDSVNTAQGYSRPYLYTKHIIEIALSNDCKADDGSLSYAVMLSNLKNGGKESEYNIAMYYSWFLFNIFQPLYGIAEDEISSFLVYEEYLHNIARNAVILGEKKDGLTNKQFVEMVVDNIKSYTEDMDERILFPKKTDEDVLKENIDAAMEQEMNITENAE